MGLRAHVTPRVQSDRWVHKPGTQTGTLIACGGAGGVCTIGGGAIVVVTRIIAVTTTKGVRAEEYAGFLAGHDTVLERIVATIIIIPELANCTFVANAELNFSGLRRKS